MPAYGNHFVLELARGIKAYLSVKAGVTRGEAPDGGARKRIEQLESALAARDRRIAGLEKREAVDPARLIWIFGTGRTGSTWLGSMMEELDGHGHWREPYVGALFGNLYYGRPESHRRSPHYIPGRHRESWLSSIRSFVLEGARARFPHLGRGGYLAVKEPHGSHGAPLLMEALPESRMILLVRDPRDVASSALDSQKKGGWVYERRRDRFGGGDTLGGASPEDIVRSISRTYLRDVGNAREAYEAHEGPKALVRYEDLRADTFQTMKHIFSALELTVSEDELVRAVEKHSFESIPEEKKGDGKFYRKATPGGWREDLTPEQAEIVEEITAPLLEEFYGGSDDATL